MKIIEIVADRNYRVVVGANALDEIKAITASHRRVLLIAPSNLIKLFKIKGSKNLSVISTPSGENQKNIRVLESVWRKCSAIGLERSDAIIGLVVGQLQIWQVLQLLPGCVELTGMQYQPH